MQENTPLPAKLSIIVPLSADETLWRALLSQLPVDELHEILLCAPCPAPKDWEKIKNPSAKWLHCAKSGRAAQMNMAAATAQGAFLWFVHADSRFATDAVAALCRSLHHNQNAVHYFDLRFYDGGWKMRINEWGVRARCALFGNPFGDQALAMSPKTFATLGGFDEDASYGEDHLLVLATKRHRIPLRRVGSAVWTSARRYDENGWWKTLILFQRLWWRQWRQQ